MDSTRNQTKKLQTEDALKRKPGQKESLGNKMIMSHGL